MYIKTQTGRFSSNKANSTALTPLQSNVFIQVCQDIGAYIVKNPSKSPYTYKLTALQHRALNIHNISTITSGIINQAPKSVTIINSVLTKQKSLTGNIYYSLVVRWKPALYTTKAKPASQIYHGKALQALGWVKPKNKGKVLTGITAIDGALEGGMKAKVSLTPSEIYEQNKKRDTCIKCSSPTEEKALFSSVIKYCGGCCG